MEPPDLICPACATEVPSLGHMALEQLVDLKKLLDSPGWRVLVSHMRSEHLGAVDRLLSTNDGTIEERLAAARVSQGLLQGLHELPSIVDMFIDRFSPEVSEP